MLRRIHKTLLSQHFVDNRNDEQELLFYDMNLKGILKLSIYFHNIFVI